MKLQAAKRGAYIAMCLCAISLAISACTKARESLGLSKNAPDEFEVVRTAPLIRPPDFDLRPPEPGSPRPNEPAIRDQAAAELFDDASSHLDRGTSVESVGEIKILERAGATNTDPGIRRKIDRDFSFYVLEEDNFLESLLFWRETEPLGDVIDAEGEAKRLRENMALGYPADEGQAPPTIKRREKALFEGIF